MQFLMQCIWLNAGIFDKVTRMISIFHWFYWLDFLCRRTGTEAHGICLKLDKIKLSLYTHLKITDVYAKESSRTVWAGIAILGCLTMRNRS